MNSCTLRCAHVPETRSERRARAGRFSMHIAQVRLALALVCMATLTHGQEMFGVKMMRLNRTVLGTSWTEQEKSKEENVQKSQDEQVHSRRLLMTKRKQDKTMEETLGCSWEFAAYARKYAAYHKCRYLAEKEYMCAKELDVGGGCTRSCATADMGEITNLYTPCARKTMIASFPLIQEAPIFSCASPYAYAPSGASSEADCVCNTGASPDLVGECAVCTAGKHKNTTGSLPCVACPANTYTAAASMECSKCPLNSISPVASTLPSQCKCQAGWTGLDGGTCSQCAGGTYKDIEGSIECIACPEFSSSQIAANQNTLCHCNQGYTGPDGGACAACVAGTYKDAPGSDGCLDCPTGKYSDTVGSSEASTCDDCGAGKFSAALGINDESDCVLCPAGIRRCCD